MLRIFSPRTTCAALVLSAAACATGTLEPEYPDTGPARILIVAEGGIAALRTITVVDSASATLSYSLCSIGTAESGCGLGVPTRLITLTREQVRDLFAKTMTDEFRALRPDYGSSTQGADLRGYIVTVTRNGLTKTVRGDDVTRPQLLADFMAAVGAPLVGT